MRIPLTKYGWPEVVLFPVMMVAAMTIGFFLGLYVLDFWVFVALESVLAAMLVWILSFFRDPYRLCPLDKSLVLSPADGRVLSVEEVEEDDFIQGPAIRINIFLSIFNAHINRSPCNAMVEQITYRKGQHRHAASAAAGKVNESNDLSIVRKDNPQDKMIVRQISGAIARRIVCRARDGQELSAGEKFGMIKFGSRTELYLSANERARCLVSAGDKVKAGITALVKYS